MAVMLRNIHFGRVLPGHRLDPFLPVDGPHLRAEAPDQHGQPHQHCGDSHCLLHEPIVIGQNRRQQG
jgi:hypothetical protein